jgi:glutathione synthase/RimK-type ligase-like ATP-grasp enzyme
MFLIIGYGGEKTTRHVCAAARSQAFDFDFLDLQQVAESDALIVEWDGSSLALTLDQRTLDFSDYSGFYSRLYFQPTGSPTRDASLSEAVSWVSAYLDGSDALVINRPSSGWSNFVKLHHARELADVGFRVPRSFITGCPRVARELTASGRWVSKPCSGTRSETVLVDDALRERMDLLRHTPSQFQEYVEGPDVRVHWLRGECFAVKIRTSSGIDYRYGEGDNWFSQIEVPKDVAERCAAFCQRAQLEFSGLDFKLDHSGEWVALEANPMPGFDYYDRWLEGTISKRLVTILAQGALRASTFIDRKRRPALSNPLVAGDKASSG